jgi:hypothetical protein
MPNKKESKKSEPKENEPKKIALRIRIIPLEDVPISKAGRPKVK